MNEIYLHRLWRARKIPPLNLKLSDGRKCTIINYGFYNESLAGPDFSMGIIEIDGVEEVGPIEMHVRSSDWFRHNHHIDARYSNVILHVVYNHDADVYQDDRLIPTLELSPIILNFDFTGQNISNEIPCINSICLVPESKIESTLQSAYFAKLHNRIQKVGESNYPRGVLYRLLAFSFGGVNNGDSFLHFSNVVPVESMIGMSKTQIFETIIKESGLFKSESIHGFDWHFKGVRPSSFPTVRMKQFATLISELIFDDEFVKASLSLNIEVIRGRIESLETEYLFSKAFVNGLILNAFIPFYYCFANTDCFSKIKNAMEHLPAEKNVITNRFVSDRIVNNNAFKSQSIIGLYKYFCTHKKCLSCGIGRTILSSRDS